MLDLSYGIKIWAEVSCVLSQFEFTRLTDGRTDIHFSHTALHSMQSGKNA